MNFLSSETFKFWDNQRNQYVTHEKKYIYIKCGVIENYTRHLFPDDRNLLELMSHMKAINMDRHEHWGARVSFRSGFLGVYAQKWDCWVIWHLFPVFKKSPHCLVI